ncbi:acyltransferase family protein [Sphingomonas lycopersici]|uniref:Acyltransferase n=1 Tax=Sphingomonas lycopersici TaxID=2951807 RepID=A0AA42CVY0_9SPHN|nr:acyltransferase [Sphingomonas lycopersici]
MAPLSRRAGRLADMCPKTDQSLRDDHSVVALRDEISAREIKCRLTKKVSMRYSPSLDGLRAVAVALVMASHFTWGRLPGGWVGVTLFFVLSGYLITKILVQELDSTGTLNLQRFYLKRFLRLSPALALVLAASLVIAILTAKLDSAVEAALFAGSYTMNFNRAFGLGEEGALGHTWSLAIEEQFYLLWPLMLLFVVKRRRIRLLLTAISIIVAWRFYLIVDGAEVQRIYNGFDTRADALLVGCLLALVEKSIPYRAWMPYVAIVTLFGCYIALKADASFIWAGGLFAATLASAALIKCTVVDGWARVFLTFKPFVFVGKLSYGLYLWHYMLLISAIRFQQDDNRVLYVTAVAVVSIGLAIASYFLVELPFNKLKDRIGRRPRTGAAAELPA